MGGFVRDLFLRQENLDIDIVIEGDAIRFANVFVRNHPNVRVRQHHKFFTAVLIFPDGFKIDLTTARREYYESPAALPVVEGGSIRLDLYRRDFTINTLAVSLSRKDFGTVIDYYRGLRDLKDGYIRVLHNLSFVEDPTRAFRAIRFEQRFRFKIGKLTANLMQNAVKNDFFLKLSGKRIAHEIRLILQEDDPAPAVMRMAEFGLLRFIHPGIAADPLRKDLLRKIKRVLDWFALTYLSEECRPWLVYFIGVLDGLTRRELADVAVRLSLLRKERQILVDEKNQADRTLNRLYRQRDLQPSEIFLLLNKLSTESILFIMAKATRDDMTRILAGYFTHIKHVRPELTGRDLIELGLQPGPLFKEVLDQLLYARLDGEVNSRDEEEALVRLRYLHQRH